jgi:uncharacterized protein YbjT (DUF2867 family)
MILAIGATGTVGSEVVKQLLVSGQKVRVLARNAEATRRRLGPDVELAIGDLAAPATLDAAMQGIEKLYLLPPLSPLMTELEANAIAAAARAGVAHVVKHSNLGAGEDSPITLPRWHRAGERLIERSGMAWTFVRPTGFMSNALGWTYTIASQGAVYGNGGAGKLSIVDPRDIAAVAATALTQPGHEGKAYDVTGPEALSMAEQVETIARALGKPLHYVDVPDTAARDAMLKQGMPAVIVDAMIEFMQLVRADRAAFVSDAVERVTGRPARTFAAWVRDNLAALR